jgi:hypothetical protein
LRNLVHPFQAGDSVWIKDWKKPLKPQWTGSHMVILTTPTALKVAGIAPWIHHSRVKRDFDSSETQPMERWTTRSDPNEPLCFQLQ